MKISTVLLIALVSLPVLFSCKKDKDKPTITPTIEGRWEGSYINAASQNSFYYSFNIKAGGVFEEIGSNGQKLGEGTWSMENNILTAHYAYPNGNEYTVIAAYYKDQAKLLGDWGYDNSGTDGGTFEMDKKN